MFTIKIGIVLNVSLRITIQIALLTFSLARRVLRSRKKTSSVLKRVYSVLKDLSWPRDITRCVKCDVIDESVHATIVNNLQQYIIMIEERGVFSDFRKLSNF